MTLRALVVAALDVAYERRPIPLAPLALTLACTLVGCSDSKRNTTANEEPEAPIVATMLRSSCYGVCPVYELRVHSDGRVRYCGEGFVKVGGVQWETLSADQLDALRLAFDDAGFSALDDAYIDDVGHSVTVVLSHDDKTIQVTGRAVIGYATGPAELELLQREFDRIVEIDQWIGTESERAKLGNNDWATGKCGVMERMRAIWKRKPSLHDAKTRTN